jgi:hypothetical protein
MVEHLFFLIQGQEFGCKCNENIFIDIMAFLPEKTYLDEILITNYDLSNGITSFTTSDVSKYITVSIQFIYSGVNGDNQFKLEQSNDSINWSDLSEIYSLPLGTGNFVIDKTTFSGKHIKVSLILINTGFLTIKLLAKR